MNVESVDIHYEMRERLRSTSAFPPVVVLPTPVTAGPSRSILMLPVKLPHIFGGAALPSPVYQDAHKDTYLLWA